jgi:hypothetical protein
MYPFAASDFQVMLRDAYENFTFFRQAMLMAVEEGVTGNCSYYGYMLDQWVTKLRGYTDVPAQWYPLYYEYRLWIKGAVEVTQPIADVCHTGGGTVSTETDYKIIDYFTAAVSRLGVMITEAQAIAP